MPQTDFGLFAHPASDMVQGSFPLPWLWGSPGHTGASKGSGLGEHPRLLCSSVSINWLVQRRTSILQSAGFAGASKERV